MSKTEKTKNRSSLYRVLSTILVCSLSLIIIFFIVCQPGNDSQKIMCATFPSFAFFKNIIILYTFDKLFIIPFIICCAIIIIFILYSFFPSTYERQTIKNYEPTFLEAYRKRDIWLNAAIAWQIFYYWLIGSSFLATLNVIYISLYDSITVTPTNQLRRIVFYSVVSILFTLLNTYISPGSIYKGYRSAYEQIDEALIRSCHTKDIDFLINARVNAEKTIGDSIHIIN